jgi:hypothetical protein
MWPLGWMVLGIAAYIGSYEIPANHPVHKNPLIRTAVLFGGIISLLWVVYKWFKASESRK